MIQHNKFQDGCFVLHRIEMNGQKYSAWFGRDGVAFSAELIFPDGNVRNVERRSSGVWAGLNKIGRRYVGL